MKRLRLLSALLACLAAVATGLPAFASVVAGAPFSATNSSATVSTTPSHCADCPDCGSNHCAQIVDCTAPCAIAVPVLAVASVGLQLIAMSGAAWPSHPSALSGEHPLPEPLPPRT